jgi:hypothetical protein
MASEAVTLGAAAKFGGADCQHEKERPDEIHRVSAHVGYDRICVVVTANTLDSASCRVHGLFVPVALR